MTLLRFDIDERREATGPGGAWSALADALSAELEPLIEADSLPIPAQKAQLTRGGGRCPVHGVLLDFDPWRPHDHRCSRCEKDYQGAAHDDWWAMGAQLWVAERAVHAAALHLLRGDPRHASLAARILASLVERYPSYPNRDNALGPTRPFFSTYLESIWLVNVCHTLSLLEEGDEAGEYQRLGRDVRRAILRPSSALIASFHEGMSNRQVWNEVAVLSALHLLGDEIEVARRLDHEDGFIGLIERGLLDDGSWYEGENYHLFAHRGMWYGVELLRAIGDDDASPLDEDLDARYHRAFLTPFAGVLPDDTLPSRRDSQYAVSIRQWRIAEYLELGRSHGATDEIDGLLTRLYDGSGAPDIARTERAHSMADSERNVAAGRLDRSSLSWRALLMASSTPIESRTLRSSSRCLPRQGLAVIRRDGGQTYVALEGGHDGGGHGHPDRLALTLQHGASRFLQDPGTGSYVERTLHWYRSTLAHHAPLVNGRSQSGGVVTLEAFEERGGAGWIVKRTTDRESGVELKRSVVVCDGYLVDLLEWKAPSCERTAVITLPIAAAASALTLDGNEIAPAAWLSSARAGAGGLEDGFDFARDVRSVDLAVSQLAATINGARARAVAGDDAEVERARIAYRTSAPATLATATVPAAPGEGETSRHWLEVSGEEGRIVGVIAWGSSAATTRIVLAPDRADAIASVTTADGTTATHGVTTTGWRIGLSVNGATSSVDLDRELRLPSIDVVTESAPEVDETDGATSTEIPIDFDVPLLEDDSGEPGDLMEDALFLPLGEVHYVRTDDSWRDAGEPTATLQLWCTDELCVADIEVSTGELVVPDEGAENPFDNERADVNADGVQWYLRHPDATSWHSAGLIVPLPTGGVRTHALVPGSEADPEVEWRLVDGGWAMRLRWSLDRMPVAEDGCLSFDLVINERPRERQRRRGQFAVSGGGRFGYLLGDRHPPDAALLLALPVATSR